MKISSFHFTGNIYHFVKTGRDKSAKANDINFFPDSSVEDFFSRHHYTEVDDIVTVTTQHNAYNVFADVMYIAFYRSHQYPGCSARFVVHCTSCKVCCTTVRFLLLDVWSKDGNRLFHYTGTFDYLWQEHFSTTKQIPDYVHAVH